MKGLLIKDFRLVKGQAQVLFVIVAIAVVLAMFTGNASFIIGYMTFIGTLFTLNTISYDEFDNGYAFLFSLPVTRKDYVMEKYAFGLLSGIGVWLFSVLTAAAVEWIRKTGSLEEVMITAFVTLPIILFLLSVMIPCDLKFGGERGRIVMIGIMGAFAVVVFVSIKVIELLKIDLAEVLNRLSMVNRGILIVIGLVISILAFLFSVNLSIAIMNKKEF